MPGPNDILPGHAIPQMNPEHVQAHYGMSHAHRHKREGRMNKFETDLRDAIDHFESAKHTYANC
jgi:predicted ATP-dependent Lon-type protease